MKIFSGSLTTNLLLITFPIITTAKTCPPSGPLLPRPLTLSSSPSIKSTLANLTSLLNNALSPSVNSTTPTINIPWEISNVSFSISVVSLTNSSVEHSSLATPNKLWEYHHLASANTDGTKLINGDNQYLIGSISKVFTDLLALKVLGERGLLDVSITKFLPGLKVKEGGQDGGGNLIRWENITVRALGEHLAGIPTTFGFPEIYPLVPLFQQIGFPELPKGAWPDCGVIGLNPGCTRQQLLKNLQTVAPVSAPFLRPIYSSLSFTLLSYAMTNITNLTYSQLLHQHIINPLNLTNTGLSGSGNSTLAVIPPTESNSWGSDYGDNAPGGGLYSSPNDLTKLLSDILSPAPKLLTRSQVNNWLKPSSVTGSTKQLVGYPWEIFRTENLIPKHPHVVDLYTKAGTAVGYQGGVTLIPEYGVGMVVLTAGAKGAETQRAVEKAVLGTVMPVVEEVTRGEAEVYVGNYSTTGTEEVEGNMRIGIDNGPGLLLLGLERNGSDILSAIHTIASFQPVVLGTIAKDLRIYPTDSIKEVTDCHGRIMVEEEWRLQFDIEEEEQKSDLPGWEEEELQCMGWMLNGMIAYAGESVDRFVFLREGVSGRVVGVRVPSLRLEMVINED